MQEVKEPLTLARAFVKLVSDGRAGAVRLAMIGDGPLLPAVVEVLHSAGLEEHVWLPGRRDDVAELLRDFDVFSLSSRVEGISNTILEAMATGLPVVATRVGGNAELIEDGVTGALVPSGSPEALAEALATYIDDPEIRRAHGRAARARVERDFAMSSMVSRYMEVYDDLFSGAPRRVNEESSTPCAG
jgi:glycosyltransferase involved in cell wall biosynthesis